MADTPEISQDVLDQLMIPSTATITTVLNGLGLWNTYMHDVSPLKPGVKMAGPAFTLRYIPAREDLDRGITDNLTSVQRVGIEQIGAGDVMVIDARGDTTGGIMGSILATRIHRRGAAGVVTDGAFRDSPFIAEIGFAVYARGMNARSIKVLHHPVGMQQPIACGGVSIYPGDIIVGDREGVVVVPRHLAVQVAEEAVVKEAQEDFILRKVQEGASIVGTYPPGEELLAEYEAWKKSKQQAGSL